MPTPGQGGGRSSGAGANRLNTGISSAQRWIDEMGQMGVRRKQLEVEEKAVQEQATSRLFMELLENQMQQEHQQKLQQQALAEQQAAAQAEGAAAGPFQVQVPPGSPMEQRPVSFDKPFTQMPNSFDALMMEAGRPGAALQPGAQAAAPGGGGMGGGLPPSAQGLPIAGPTQQTRQTTLGMDSQVVEDPFRFITLARPSFSQTTSETPNELGARDVADLRNQESGLQIQRDAAAQRGSEFDRSHALDTARTANDFYKEREKLAIDRAQLEINRAEAKARMQIAQATAAAKGEKFTPGEEALDKEYATKAYAPQLSGGLSAAASDIESLKAITQELAAAAQPGAKQNLTGPVIGALPTSVTAGINPPAADVKRRLESVLQKTAKTVLDSQYAAKELADYLAREADTQQEEGVVVQRLVPLVNRLEFDLGEAQRKAQHFRGNGTLRGYTPQPVPEELTDKALAEAGKPKAATATDDSELFKKYGIQ